MRIFKHREGPIDLSNYVKPNVVTGYWFLQPSAPHNAWIDWLGKSSARFGTASQAAK